MPTTTTDSAYNLGGLHHDTHLTPRLGKGKCQRCQLLVHHEPRPALQKKSNCRCELPAAVGHKLE